MPIIRRERESEFRNPHGFAEISAENGLPLIIHTDELWEEFNGTQGRVNIGLSIARLAFLIDHLDDAGLTQLVRKVSKNKGIHRGRLELTLEHVHVSSVDFAVKILAHHFNVGAEVLVGLGTQDVFSKLANLPGSQAEGFRMRMLREGRFQEIPMWDVPVGQIVHLLSNGTLFQVIR